jgi:hypothetical protein
MSGPSSIQEFFPCGPEYSSWEDYNGNLVMFYGREPIGHFAEEDWKIAASQVSELATFANYPVPSPELYTEWQEWAKDFSQIVNGPSY